MKKDKEDNQAFHVVLTTNNSRTSQRMIRLGIRKGEPVELNLEGEITLTRIIGAIIIEQGYHCLAYNICKDHVHLILVCEREKLSKTVQMIKGTSSYLFKSKDFNPVSGRLWSQKFFRAYLDIWELATRSHKPGYVYRDSHLTNALNYIRHNREKHKLPASDELQNIINSFIVSQETAFGIE
jgi:REP element-mobilizing transposase RayT